MAEGRVHPTVLLGAVAAIGIANAVGIALAPALLTHSPLALIALSPLGRHLVLAATVTPIVPFVIVGTLRRMLVATLGYMLGRAYGRGGISWIKERYPKLEPLLRPVEWLFARAAPLILLVAPGPLVCALAGATGMRAWLVLPIATVGQTGWMLINYKLGEAFGEWLAPITEYIRTHMLPMTLACIAIVLVYRWFRRDKQLKVLHETVGGVHQIAPSDAGPPVPPSEQQRS
jgi:membrane protein DedA with SNARE-associated domain